MERITCIVQLFIDGPIAVTDRIRFQEPKGFNRRTQFYSDIRVEPSSSGLRMSVTAYASESNLARKAALVFVGEMLDVMATDFNFHSGLVFTTQELRIPKVIASSDW